MAAHEPLARRIDRPIAGLLAGPQTPRHARRHARRLDDRVWPHPRTGRRARAAAITRRVFSSWLAGGGIKPGIVHGSSDEIGAVVAENGVHVHDFHATILHLLGIDHERLTYRHAGRDYRLTDVYGDVVEDILA